MESTVAWLAGMLSEASDQDLDALSVQLIALRDEHTEADTRLWWSLHLLRDFIASEFNHRLDALEGMEADLNGGHLTKVWRDLDFGWYAWCHCEGIDDTLYPTSEQALSVARAHCPDVEPLQN